MGGLLLDLAAELSSRIRLPGRRRRRSTSPLRPLSLRGGGGGGEHPASGATCSSSATSPGAFACGPQPHRGPRPARADREEVLQVSRRMPGHAELGAEGRGSWRRDAGFGGHGWCLSTSPAASPSRSRCARRLVGLAVRALDRVGILFHEDIQNPAAIDAER